MELDFSDPSKLQTRDGREVRIYATDHTGGYPVAGAIKNPDGWKWTTWTTKGQRWSGSISDCDLIPKPQRVTGWVNIAPSGLLYDQRLFASKEDAASYAGLMCIGQIYIDAEVQT